VSKLKNMSRAGWVVTGIVATLLLVPTVALAATTTTTIIKGGSGNKASVTGANQLLTAVDEPSLFYQSGESHPVSGGDYVPVAVSPSGLALVITVLHIDAVADPTPGSSNVQFTVDSNSTCTGGVVGSFGQEINPGAIGETDISLEPGVGVPTGGSLCALALNGMNVQTSASGYVVGSSVINTGPVHRVGAVSHK
jgi:hypothetical protein